jgi:hypothetical protein
MKQGIQMGDANKRVFNVYLGNTFLFRENNAKEESGKISKPDLFAEWRSLRNRVTEIFDAFPPSVAAIKALKDDPRFAERCDFKVLDLYANKKLIAEFEGDFIDALIWVRNNMTRVQHEHGENLGAVPDVAIER